jgi:hypothetical protein
MAYYVYQNYPTDRVVIHKGHCSFCNDGSGVQENPLGDENGKWHKAPNVGYDTYREAKIKAEQLANEMNTEFQNCKRCNPHI